MDAFARVQKTIIFLFSIFFVIFALSFAGFRCPPKEIDIWGISGCRVVSRGGAAARKQAEPQAAVSQLVPY
jgi:hypothetical protein